MKKIFSFFAAFVLFAGAIMASGDTHSNAATQTSNDLISQLPASDAVATVNLKKLLNEAMPQLLASQPAKLTELNAKIDEVKIKFGIDLRQFEQAAVGMTFKPGASGKQVGADSIYLLRGNFNAAGLIAVGKIAANGKFRQEQIGDQTVTIFTIPSPPPAANKQSNQPDAIIDQAVGQNMSGEFAVYALDGNTLAGGKLPQIRQMITNKSANNHVSANLTEMVNRNQNAVVSFAGNVPSNMSASFNMGNDQIGKIFKSLRQTFGAIDLKNGAASFLLAARTAEEPQARELEETLQGLQMLGKGFLGSKTDDKSQVLSHAVENLKITRNVSEVQLQTNLSPDDLDKLVKGNRHYRK